VLVVLVLLLGCLTVTGAARLQRLRRDQARRDSGLPFASVADARKSATALRALGGGNTVRFLLSWAYAEPVRGQVDPAYLSAATAQIRAFLDVGIRVYPDFHHERYV
jgi:hypothetical protein